MKGFPVISPFSLVNISGSQPAFIDNIIRRFQRRENNNIIDSIAGRNANLIGNVNSSFLDDSDFYIDFKNEIPADFEYSFFDKSNVRIWKDTVRNSNKYDSSNPFKWHQTELNQQFIYNNIQDAYKYYFWIKFSGKRYYDFILYNNKLLGDDICKTKNYVGIGETYTTIESNTLICKTDIIQ